MLLQVETKKIEPDIMVVEMTGRVQLGAESRELEKTVQEILGRGTRKVILNLAAVQYLDSTGIGTIAVCFSLVKKAGGSMRIAGAAGRIWQLFQMTKLDTVLPFSPSVEEAAKVL